VPLRLPRLAQAVAVIGLASAPLVGFAMPAHAASQVRSQLPGLTAAQALQAMSHSRMSASTPPPPHAKPAGHGALPWRRPAAPSVPSNLTLILRDVLTDALISAAVLGCLLVPIMWYGSIMKRRDRRVALAAADRAQHSMLGSSGRGIGDDPLLDFFGPQAAPAGIPARPQRGVSGPKYQPRPALSGRSTLTPAFAPKPMLPAPHTADSGAWGGSAPWNDSASWSDSDRWSDSDESRSGAWDDAHDANDGDAWGARSARAGADREDPPRGQDHGQSSTLRHAPVAGTPPWEPAPQPTGELPWAVLSGPGTGSGRSGGFGGRPSQPPPESLWNASSPMHSAPPSSMFDGDPERDSSDDMSAGSAARQAPGPDRRSDSDWRSIPGEGSGRSGRTGRSGSGERPIYVWDPDRTADDDGSIRSAGGYED
jgi:hypothetical protein